jgi:4-aminobutyrate aminotransferase
MSGTDFYYEPEIRLAERLCRLAPVKQPSHVFFTDSGPESMKLP